MEQESGATASEGGAAPNTAHAVLGEGSLNCLAFSRKGLFAAGKVGLHKHSSRPPNSNNNVTTQHRNAYSSLFFLQNGYVYCFSAPNELKVLEQYILPSGHSISCLTWSPDYTRLAIGTDQVITTYMYMHSYTVTYMYMHWFANQTVLCIIINTGRYSHS